MDKIVFSGEPFWSHVDGEKRAITPVVFDGHECGLGIIYGGGKERKSYGMITPRDLIAAWRGTEVLRCLCVIEEDTLLKAYHTGSRFPLWEDEVRYINPIIEIIGQSTYRRIMNKPVSEAIIRFILDNQNDDMFSPQLSGLTEEVGAGTIQWRSEFAAAGLERPVTGWEKSETKKRILRYFEPLLSSYAEAMGLSRKNCVIMEEIERTLIKLVQNAWILSHSSHILVALAGVVGGIRFNAIGESRRGVSLETQNHILKKNSRWLSRVSGYSRFFWKPRRSLSPKQADERLRLLLDDCFPLYETSLKD